MTQFRFLFEPIQLGPIRVRNRVVFSAHLTNFAQHNEPSEKLTEYYRERARGGAGLIITEEQSVHPSDFAYEKLIHAYRESVLPGFRSLTSAVKEQGTTVFCQINHNGGQGFSFFNDEPLWGPSNIEDGLFREVPQEVEENQIQAVIAGYERVAELVRLGGFDGAELQASHSSILRQFLSPYTNRRDDEWGGSFDNRLRLMIACLQATRRGLGDELALGVRLCTDELIDGGLTLPDVVEVARKIDESGLVDFINTSIGTTARLYMVEGPMSVPAGYQSVYTAAIREAVTVPVIGVGRINDPVAAERILEEGVADMVGVVRGQIADPDWTRKSKAGNAGDIRKCIACNQYCIGLMGLNQPLSCIQNPANGLEGILGGQQYKSIGLKKKVVVVGGGPAGMEAAIVAARHGHQVDLFEQGDRLGGNVNLIVQLESRLEYGDLIRNKNSEINRYGVGVHLGVEATLEMLLSDSPDVVVLATGQEEQTPSHIPGMEGERVRTPIQLLSGPKPKELHALVLDEIGFHQAASVVEFLVSCGCSVSFVTTAFCAGQDLGVTLDLELWHRRISKGQTQFYSGHMVTDVSGDPVLVDIYSGEEKRLESVDMIVPVNQGRPRDSLYRQLSSEGISVLRVGDALAPKDVGEAILDGHRAGWHISGVDLGWR